MQLRIFLSSPGDVGTERAIASAVIERLKAEFSNRVAIETYLWERSFMRATETFQAQVVDIQDADLAIFILWTRMGTMLPPDVFSRPDGSPYMSGTEYEFERAIEACAKHDRPDVVFYRKTAPSVLNIKNQDASQEQYKQIDRVNTFVKRWFINPDGTFRSAYFEFEEPAKLGEILELHVRDWLKKRLAGETAVQAPSWHGAPFRGLEVFNFEHSLIYCGRTHIVADVLDALRARAQAGHAFIMLMGMSGAGKSSMVRAGLMPMLARPNVVEGVVAWRRVVFRPSTSLSGLWVGLAAALLTDDALPELQLDEQALAKLLENPDALVPALTRALDVVAKASGGQPSQRNETPTAKLIILIDQFEELFDSNTTAEDRNKFAAMLSRLARSGLVWVVATLRADYFGRCAELPEDFRDLYVERGGIYTLGGPRPAEIAQIIRVPVAMAGLTFERRSDTDQSLDELIINDAIARPTVLPLLEFALDELWKSSGESRLLRFADYEKLGGLEGALKQRADEVFSRLPEEARQALPQVLSALARTDVSDTDLIVQDQASLHAFDALPHARTLIDAFVSARLFVANRSSEGSSVLGLAHEALLREWQPATLWIKQHRQLLQLRANVSAAFAVYVADRRSDERLLSGPLLKDAVKMSASAAMFLPAEERDFIERSKTHANRLRFRRTAQVALVGILIFIAIMIPTIGADKIAHSFLVAKEMLATWDGSPTPKISGQSLDKLQRSVSNLTQTLTPQVDKFGVDPAQRSWAAAETWLALQGSDRGPEGNRLRQLTMAEHRGCACWREAEDRPSHRMATGWVLYALARYHQAATREEIQELLSSQSPDGWWSMFPATSDRLNGSTAATAWIVLALNEQLAAGLVADDQKPLVAGAVRAAMAWLVTQVKPGTARWHAYPPSQAAEQADFPAISALVIHVLHRVGNIRTYDRLWLQELAQKVPTPLESETAKGIVYQPNNGFTLDDSRHYAFPWMLRVTLECYSQGTWFERASAIVWLNELLAKELAAHDFNNQVWTMAEALFALREAQQILTAARR